jgi:archaeosine-15-forming tRNA-guanine transglycosylase
MPVTEINAIDLNAGCFAKIKMPSPEMVVMAERKIDDLKGRQIFFAGFILLQQTIHNKDAVIVAKTKDESGYYDVDDVEFSFGYGHNAQYPYP